ncbi:alpha/beta fold hydrolase [Buchnera aphidicola]|uniref:Pimeloyl-[acyl-carrier protein] methyl ester esterase n=1 Tax=Buchnera aphidicola subsp. Tuberolachnus salignus TaxID=98804 RepID=A0A160SZE2_BUCTT|nr:alpha/beta fold hydrolase [Buchnera aphidicola]CUR53336.1 Pimeloyl-[acyl-carrier protein] methyl ester esterase [Buchnera aphidicola (Tuberolachnus salignus)]
MKKILWSVYGIGKIPIVLFHGWGFNSNIWYSIFPFLLKKFTIYVFDFPGYGNNSNIHLMNFTNISNFLLSILPHKVIWIGWSLGGLLATYIGYYFPNRTYAVILIASSPFFLKKNKWPGIKKKTLISIKNNMLNSYQNFLLEFYNIHISLKKNSFFTQKKIFQNFFTKLPTSDAILQGFQWLKKIDNRKKIINLKIPIFRIYGKLDLLIPIKIEKKLKNILYNGKFYIIKQAAHVPFITHPKLFLNIINDIIYNIKFF